MRIALCPLNPTVGDLDLNADLILDAARDATSKGASMLVLPELCLTGYPPRDLILHRSFIHACEDRIARIVERCPPGLTLVFGSPLPTDTPRPGVTNSLVACHDGQIIARYHKRLLPTYDVFDEDRYFVAGSQPVAIDVAGTRVGLSICEDLWRGIDAHTDERYAGEPDHLAELASMGCTLVVNPSASPFVLGKRVEHANILKAQADARRVTILAVNQAGANDDQIFDGVVSLAAPNAEVIPLAQPFAQPRVIVVDLENDVRVHAWGGPRSEPQDLFDALTLGVRDYLRKTGFKRVLIGLSGGIDSAVTAAIAVAAIGHDNVTGVAMPGPYSSEHSVRDAIDLAERLRIRCITTPIARPFAGFEGAVDEAFAALNEPRLGAISPDLARENLQSRVRGSLLMTLSNRTGALVLTTGNKSELAVGYCTLYGDMNGGLAVLSDLGKMQVYALAHFMNDRAPELGFDRPPIPDDTITKPPSAELAPDQKDADSLPDYEVLDEIVHRFVELRESPERIITRTQFDEAVVHRICALIARNEYKRRQAAVGLKVSRVAFGQGRRMPIAQNWRPPTHS